MPITTLEETTSHKRLRVFSAIAAVIAVVQVLVAMINMSMRNDIISALHEGLGYLYVAAAVVTVFPAVVWGRLSRRTSLVGHAAGMAGIGVVQLLLGMFAPPEGGVIVMVHAVLGLLILLGAISLFFMAKKKPIVVTNAEGAPHAD